MIKRIFDLFGSFLGLTVSSPFLIVVAALVWADDRKSPIYVASRVGRLGKPFKMVKMRSMTIGADRSGVSSTSNSDARITKIGHFIRRYKVDELTQLWNVFLGDMSIVGPRPQVPSGVAVYTELEKKLLTVKPGITDFSSIVFADEGLILSKYLDPELAYDQLIRPIKSRLGLFYVDNQSISLDIALCCITLISGFARPFALRLLTMILNNLDADPVIIMAASRTVDLCPMPPPGVEALNWSPAPLLPTIDRL